MSNLDVNNTDAKVDKTYFKVLSLKDSNGEIFNMLNYSDALLEIVDRVVDKLNDKFSSKIKRGTIPYDIIAMICLSDRHIGLLDHDRRYVLINIFGFEGHRTGECTAYLDTFVNYRFNEILDDSKAAHRAIVQMYLTTTACCYPAMLNLLRALTGQNYRYVFEKLSNKPVYFDGWTLDDFYNVPGDSKTNLYMRHLNCENSVLNALDDIYRIIIKEACGKDIDYGVWIKISQSMDLSWTYDETDFMMKYYDLVDAKIDD